ncbi:uncharacterized protein LOC134259455 [Saccostrea cucullata]|uniref:uncharacterized protein LOC134259455 n=1 Tax=Saccostrea cuccullata TaxID=36930 RepID=UPI002ED6369C
MATVFRNRSTILSQLIIFLVVIAMLVETKSIRVKRWIKCASSLSSMTIVPSCPYDENTYIKRARLKNCSAVKACWDERCVYHCALNPWGNATIEVCAPETHLTGSYCIQYNPGVGRIFKLYSRPCKECPFNYNSTTSYKYQSCYKDIGDQETSKSDENSDPHAISNSLFVNRNSNLNSTINTVNNVSHELKTSLSSSFSTITHAPQSYSLHTKQRVSNDDDVNYGFLGGALALFVTCSIFVLLIIFCKEKLSSQIKQLKQCLADQNELEDNKDIKEEEKEQVVKYQFDKTGKRTS